MVISHHRAGDDGFVPFILQAHLCNGYIELAVQTRDERLNPSALFFEGSAGWEVKVNGEGGEQGEFSIYDF